MTARHRALAILLSASALAAASCADPRDAESPGRARILDPAATRMVTDMRGVAVPVPARVSRVATISDGFVESVMFRLGTIRALVALGSSSQQRTWEYRYEADDGRTLSVADGTGTMRALHPWLADLPCASYTSGDAVNYETIAAARPDVVILRAGDCTVGASGNAASRIAGVFGAMGIPAIVLRSPADYRGRGLETLREEIAVLGALFEREGEASALAGELAAAEEAIRARVRDVPQREKPRVLYLGLSSGARSSGGAAFAWGRESAESWMIERVIGARNAYPGPGSRVLLNAEQILALDPDVIFLPTSGGYHPPWELAEAPRFRELRRLRAVREGRVYPLPWTPMNCARRLEYPLDLMVMGKGTYPGRFADVAVHAWALEFYRRTYRIDENQARALRRAQWLDWTVEAGF